MYDDVFQKLKFIKIPSTQIIQTFEVKKMTLQ